MQENSSDADLQHYGKSCFEISPHGGDGKTNVKEWKCQLLDVIGKTVLRVKIRPEKSCKEFSYIDRGTSEERDRRLRCFAPGNPSHPSFSN